MALEKQKALCAIKKIAGGQLSFTSFVQSLGRIFISIWGVEGMIIAVRLSSREYLTAICRWNAPVSVFRTLMDERVLNLFGGRSVIIREAELRKLRSILPISLLHRTGNFAFGFAAPICFGKTQMGFVLFSTKLNQKKIDAREAKEMIEVMRSASAPMENAWFRYRLTRLASKLRKTRRSSTLKIDEALKRQGEYLAALSHEMKTPLALIRHHIMRGEENKGQVDLRAVSCQIQNLSQLISDIIFLTKLESGNDTGQKMLTDTEKVIVEICDEFELMAKEKEIDFKNCIQGNLFIRLNPARMKRALRNIVLNALLYTKAGGSVEVHARQERNGIKIAILDTGVGMGENECKNVFSRFYRGAAARNMSSEGSGLGLSIVKRIVDEHRGSIEIKSEEGQGTAVVVRLPSF